MSMLLLQFNTQNQVLRAVPSFHNIFDWSFAFQALCKQENSEKRDDGPVITATHSHPSPYCREIPVQFVFSTTFPQRIWEINKVDVVTSVASKHLRIFEDPENISIPLILADFVKCRAGVARFEQTTESEEGDNGGWVGIGFKPHLDQIWKSRRKD
ncbi:hypothetical protein C8J57DRAFT_1230181 [Mycena rebaudengoi]|nr:hypothetical protein C8J57DRAFT_1230181 [Mycena rebaudengoi]